MSKFTKQEQLLAKWTEQALNLNLSKCTKQKKRTKPQLCQDRKNSSQQNGQIEVQIEDVKIKATTKI